MKDQDLFEIIPQVFSFIGTQYPERQADQCPQVNYRISATVMLTQFMYLGMAVVTGRNTIVGTGRLDLLVFEFSILKALFLKAGLEKSPTPSAAIVVGSVRFHVDKVFFTHYRFDHIP